MPELNQPELADEVSKLEAWLRAVDPPSLSPWRSVRVIEVLLGPRHPTDWDAAVSVPEFEPRWAVITSTVDRYWVNLSAVGVREETLIVTVEWHAPVDSSHRRTWPLSVNFSGPARGGPAWER